MAPISDCLGRRSEANRMEQKMTSKTSLWLSQILDDVEKGRVVMPWERETRTGAWKRHLDDQEDTRKSAES